jgi:hypothetical protein
MPSKVGMKERALRKLRAEEKEKALSNLPAEEAESKLKKRKYENERNNKMKEAGRTPIES